MPEAKRRTLRHKRPYEPSEKMIERGIWQSHHYPVVPHGYEKATPIHRFTLRLVFMEMMRVASPSFLLRQREVDLTQAAADVLTERERQIEKGYTSKHDDQHDDEELGRVAGGYLKAALDCNERRASRENLVMAAAVLLAEIERRDRAEDKPSKGEG